MQSTPLDNNMHNEIQGWTLASFCTSLFTTLYNLFHTAINKVVDWGVSEWVAVLGVCGMAASLLMQLYFNARQQRLKEEKHAWERAEHLLKLKQFKQNPQDG